MNIYVSNLSYSTDADSLQQLFAEYGEVTSANIITDRETGRSRGFGFVEMPDDNEAQKAIEELHETDFQGKTINVSVARPRTERSDNRGGFNRGGGGFNRGGGGGGFNRGGGGGGFNRGGGDGGYGRNRY
ncbi:RNA recognition motif domain-containing protein [Massilibacteroides vaginae]|uniref:RNA recognition motif domain-containing protein n=1 Tax=Massilibacteroides vaginae TaxID=1673718 RepID=UPI000A1CC6FA|nr:RNA-binding protein [Massilibacteroides vaginae]